MPPLHGREIAKSEDIEVENKTAKTPKTWGVGHPCMPQSQRAKQFAPYAALGGLDDALKQKEWEVSAREKAKHHVTKLEADE